MPNPAPAPKNAGAVLHRLRALPDNSIYLPMLIRQMSSAGIVPFVGAGLSAAFGFPLWGRFLKDSAAVVGLEDQITQRLKAGQYEEAAEDLVSALTSEGFQDRVQHHFGDHVLDGKTLSGAVAIVPAIARGPVITTNFDRVLETIFRQAGRPFESEIRASAANLAIPALQENRSVLLKIHGDWSDPDNRVLTLSEYKQTYGDPDGEIDLDRSLPRLLYLLTIRPVLFLGCSLDQDRTVTIFKRIADKLQSRHFAIVAMPSEPEAFRKRREFLLQRNIRPIWYTEGQHAEVEVLLRYLASEVPSHLRAAQEKKPTHTQTIPVPLTSFVGREQEQQDLRGLLAKSRLLTVSGPPGSGKTRIAIEIARASESDFDSVWFVELSQMGVKDKKLVGQRVAATLHIYQPGPLSAEDQLAAHLESGRHLIILDNCDRLAKSCATLALLLIRRCPGLKIICTSRRTLETPGEQVYRIPPLELPAGDIDLVALENIDAVKLFLERVRARTPFILTAANASHVVLLCRRLEGIPLAIELAAAQLQTLSVQQVLERLDEQLNWQTAGEGEWVTLAKAMKLSHELLDRKQAILFRRMAIFHRGWTLEAAAAVYEPKQADDFDILQCLNQLHSASLLVVEERGSEKRFRMLDFVRDYALKRLRDLREEPSVAARHAQWFAALAERSQPELLKRDQAKWLDALAVEADNLRAAITYSVETKDAETALRLTGSLWRMMEIRGFYAEGIKRLETVLAMPEAAAFPELRARALGGLGMLRYRQGEMAAAETCFEQRLPLETSIDRIADTWNDLGNVDNYRGDFDLARAKYRKAIDALGTSASPCPRETAVIFFNMGTVERRLGHFSEAAVYMKESLQLFEKDGNEREAGFAWNGLARIELARGNFVLAQQHVETSLKIGARLEDSKGAADARRTFAALRLKQGDIVGGHECLRLSMEATRTANDKRGMAENLELLAAFAAKEGDHERCISLCAAAGKLRRELHIPLSPIESAELDQILDAARSAVGPTAAQNAWEKGMLW